MSFPYVADIKLSSLEFSPLISDGGRNRVDVKTCNGRNVQFNLTPDVSEPIDATFALDLVRDDTSDPLRRGQSVIIYDTETERGNKATYDALKALDALIIAKAVENSENWFKGKQLSYEQVEARYKPLVGPDLKRGNLMVSKFKVKCPGSKVPTRMHLMKEHDIVQDAGRVSHLEYKGAKLSATISTYGVWFMGGGTQFGMSMQAEELIVTPAMGPEPLANFSNKRSIAVISHTGEESEMKVALEGEASEPVQAM
jgi:hypothetical protein